MGWVSDDGGGHEGYVAYVAPDGRTTGGSTGRGVLLSRADADERAAAAWAADRVPSNDDLYELVVWDDVVGWQVGCACGWTGRRWLRDETRPGSYGGRDAEDVYLPDGRSVEDHGLELWQAHMAPVGRLAAIERAADALAEAREQLDLAVREARAQDPALSWAEIGRAAGMSRQSAHERWSAEPNRSLSRPIDPHAAA